MATALHFCVRVKLENENYGILFVVVKEYLLISMPGQRGQLLENGGAYKSIQGGIYIHLFLPKILVDNWILLKNLIQLLDTNKRLTD